MDEGTGEGQGVGRGGVHACARPRRTCVRTCGSPFALSAVLRRTVTGLAAYGYGHVDKTGTTGRRVMK